MPMSLRAAAVAGLAALLISVDSPAALAATAKKAPVQSGQGETLELLLSQQKSGQSKFFVALGNFNNKYINSCLFLN